MQPPQLTIESVIARGVNLSLDRPGDCRAETIPGAWTRGRPKSDRGAVTRWHDGPVGWRSRSRSRLGGNTRRRGELAAALAASGFWSGVPGQDVRLLLAEVVAGKPPLTWLGERGWPADGEDLAEGDVEELLTSMTGALRRHGVSLTVESVRRLGQHGSTGYSIRINGRRLDLIDVHPANPRLPLAADPWLECTVKPLGLVNELLEEAGSDHRVAVFNAGGNDGLAVLLPVAAIGVLTDSDLIPDGDRPLVPEPPEAP